MKVLVQHTFNSGLGDFLNCIYEYFETCYNLKENGYNEFILKLYLNNNSYFQKDDFFYFFKKEKFQEIFNNIEIIDEPIRTNNYENMGLVSTIGGAQPGAHLWDLYVEDSNNVKIKNYIRYYSYIKPNLPFIDIFNERIIDNYNNLKKIYNLDNYVSIYYRTEDLNDNIETYENYKEVFNTIIKNSEKIYVCSNSFLLKKYLKKFSNKIIIYDIIGEEINGNHSNYDKFYFNDKNITDLRTEFAIYEMLTLSDSNEINFFTVYNRESNFLLLSKVKSKNIKNY